MRTDDHHKFVIMGKLPEAKPLELRDVCESDEKGNLTLSQSQLGSRDYLKTPWAEPTKVPRTSTRSIEVHTCLEKRSCGDYCW